MITENLSTLKIHKLTQAQYERERDANRLDENALYLTPDESFVIDETLSVSGAAADAKAVGDAINSITSGGSNITVDDALSSTSLNPVQNKVIYEALDNKVDKDGDKVLSTYDFSQEYKDKLDSISEGAGNNNIDVDDALSATSTNPVQNKVVYAAIDVLDDKIGGSKVSEQIESVIGPLNTSIQGKVDKVEGSRLITEYEAEKLESLVIGDGGQIEISGTVNASNVQGLDDLLATKVDKITGKGLSTNDYTTTEKNKLAGIDAGANKIDVDDALSNASTNPVQNKVVYAAIDDLDDKIGGAKVSEQIEDAIGNLVSAVTTTGSGNAITKISKNGNTITAAKDGSFLSSQLGIGIASDVTLTHGGEFKVIRSVESKENTLYTYLQTYKLPSETELSIGTASGSGNAVTGISVSGHEITLVKDDTFSKSDHGHSVATTSTDGFMSSTDKSTLDTLDSYMGGTPVSEQISNAIKNITTNITTYTDPSQFGCTFASTITEVCNAIPNNSIFMCDANKFTDTSWNLPSKYGTIVSFKQSKHRKILNFYGKTLSVGDYQMDFNDSSGEPTGEWTMELRSVLHSSMYGTQLPGEDGKPYTHTPGRLFFLKASD